MLEFEKACSAMGLVLEEVDLSDVNNAGERRLAKYELNASFAQQHTLWLLGFYDVAVMLVSLIIGSIILLVSEANDAFDPITLTVLLAILAFAIMGSIGHFVSTRITLRRLEPICCRAFKLTCNPASLEDIASGVLQFRVLELVKELYTRTGDFLVLVKDGAIPYLISYATQQSWGQLEFSNTKLLVEVLKDVE